jgi:hypothetical protein
MHWLTMLRRLSLLADGALANRIVEAERLKTAELRLDLYDREGRHMCLMPGCRNPVVGRLIFAHCERHLESYEQRWLKEEIETKPYERPATDESVHPTVQMARKGLEERDKQLAEQNASKKMDALAEARELLSKAAQDRAERYAYLPAGLRQRIEETAKTELDAVGWEGIRE